MLRKTDASIKISIYVVVSLKMGKTWEAEKMDGSSLVCAPIFITWKPPKPLLFKPHLKRIAHTQFA